jgi:uncharacterized protein (DUF58 family)
VNVSPDDVARARGAAVRCADVFRLPFRRELWRGAAGNWAGAGVGSSIDFQDHRPYVPGDDPRYIDWHAYARTDHYVMKLYREEVSPAVDLVLDASASMCADEAKKRRSLELFYFVLESAIGAGAALRPWIVTGGNVERWDVASVTRDASWFAGDGARVDASLLRGIDFRAGSLRVLVSDCLFPGEPELAVNALASSKGRGVVLAPSSAEESDPRWLGQVELEDCETGIRRVEHFDDARLESYRAAYRRHFELWENSCRRRGMPFAHIPAELDLSDALRTHALRVSAVEPAA